MLVSQTSVLFGIQIYPGKGMKILQPSVLNGKTKANERTLKNTILKNMFNKRLEAGSGPQIHVPMKDKQATQTRGLGPSMRKQPEWI